jgi:pimeloyl-ACP methyl ester carboxylesterase
MRSFIRVAATGTILALQIALTTRSADEVIPKPLGKLVGLGGRRLHVNLTGAGAPVVVMENGGGAFSVDWALVQPEVAKFARVLTYDRAGYAWSDRGPTQDTWHRQQTELAAHSSAGKLVTADKSGHLIQLDRPDLVGQAIREVVAAARTK